MDSKPTLTAYANSMGLKSLNLLADFHPKGDVGRKYGLYLDEKGIDARATVVVGRDGKVTWVKVNDLGVQRENAEILGACSAGAKA